MENNSKKRVLFFCEAVTFAHITRLYTLATYLPSTKYEIHFACSSFPDLVFKNLLFTKWSIYSITPKEFSEALAKGRETHSIETLHRYVKEDLSIIDKVKPDIIIGDFRLSLSVSARKSCIQYINITNAYWSPYHTLKILPAIDHPIFNMMGEKLGSCMFNKSMNLISKMLIRPYNQIRKFYNLNAYASLAEAYTDGDFVMYCDIPEIVPTFGLPDKHSYMGPIFWVSNLQLPIWENELKGHPIIFLSMGSSGKTDLMPSIIDKLSQLPILLVVATAGKEIKSIKKSNIFLTDYLPLDWIAKKANIFINNGGSPLAYQAIYQGVPVIGITTNFDQQLCMEYISRIGAGVSIKSGMFSMNKFLNYVINILKNPEYKQNALKIKNYLEKYDSKDLFACLLHEIIANRT